MDELEDAQTIKGRKYIVNLDQCCEVVKRLQSDIGLTQSAAIKQVADGVYASFEESLITLLKT